MQSNLLSQKLRIYSKINNQPWKCLPGNVPPGSAPAVKLIDFGDAKDVNEKILEDEDIFEHNSEEDDQNFDEEDEEIKRIEDDDEDIEDNILLMRLKNSETSAMQFDNKTMDDNIKS